MFHITPGDTSRFQKPTNSLDIYVVHSLNMIWIWGVCLYWVGDVTLCFYLELVFYFYISLGLELLLQSQSAARTEMILKTTFMAFLPNAGQSLYECIVLHLLHVLLSLVLLRPLLLCELLALVPFLLRLNVLITSTVVGCADPSIGFLMVKVFDRHLMLLGILE